jgi:hypothetical protein
MLSVTNKHFMLNVVRMSVVMLNVMAPFEKGNHRDLYGGDTCLLSTDDLKVKAGNTKGGSMTVPLTSCLTGFD